MKNISSSKREILAFTHIKKAGGTTLSHILRANFLFRHCDVRVLKKQSKKVFQAADMSELIKINPFVKSIAGHSVLPFGDLDRSFKKTRFITMLRDPSKRFMSQYQYNVEKLGYRGSFEDFLNIRDIWNRQVKTIAGSENIRRAKEILKNKFLLVGVVEEFDEFLILLKMKLHPTKFHPGYRIQNIGKKDSPIRREMEQDFEHFHKQIEERNSLDIELYNFVLNELLPKERKRYGSRLKHDVEEFQQKAKNIKNPIPLYLDYAVRKLYYRPMFNSIRKRNGF